MRARLVAALLLLLAVPSWADPPAPTPSPITDADERDRRYEEKFRALEQMIVAADRRYADLRSADQRAVDAALSAAKEAVAAALQAAKEAVSKAEAASEKRFDSVNEFRQQQRDLIGTFATQVGVADLKKALEILQARMDTMQGAQTASIAARTDYRDNTGMWVGIATLIMALVVGVGGLIVSRRAPAPK